MSHGRDRVSHGRDRVSHGRDRVSHGRDRVSLNTKICLNFSISIQIKSRTNYILQHCTFLSLNFHIVSVLSVSIQQYAVTMLNGMQQ